MTGRGIAGSTTAEVEGVYLATVLDQAWWFASFDTHDRVDVWEVDATNLALVPGPHGHDYYPGSIPPECIRLLEADVDPADMWRRLSEEPSRADDETSGTVGDILAFKPTDDVNR
jgi:hypothetical protein